MGKRNGDLAFGASVKVYGPTLLLVSRGDAGLETHRVQIAVQRVADRLRWDLPK